MDTDVVAVLQEAITDDTGCAVALLSTTGQVRVCNTTCATTLDRQAPADLIGTRLTEALPPSMVSAHKRAQQQAIDAQQPVVIDGPFGGRRSLATYRLLHTAEDTFLLLVIAAWTPDAQIAQGQDTIVITASEDGPLADLTPRELDVLRGIAAGFSTSEIAHALHRSVKTIEGHRVSLGNKLNVRNRVQLAQLAWLWGVTPLTMPSDPSAPPAAS